MSCTSCGSSLKSIEYQARSADEAQRQIFRCPNCPLNIDEFTKQRKPTHVHLSRTQRNISYTPLIKPSTWEDTKYVCATSRHIDIDSLGLDKSDLVGVEACNYVDVQGHMYRYYHSGQWSNAAVRIVSTLQICPNISIVEVRTIKDIPDPSRNYVIHQRLQKDGTEYILDGSNISVWQTVHEQFRVQDAVQRLYTLGFAPSSLTQCISSSMLGSLSNLTSRAYDKYSVPDYQNSFSTKPDGERMWITRIGAIWFYSRRLSAHKIVGWHIDYTDCIHTQGPILDVEFMIGFKPILIDVLMDERGVISKPERKLSYVMDTFKKMILTTPYLNRIHIREFHSTLENAAKDRDSVTYPVDGIVAISNDGTDMFKIKSEKSMELRIMQDGTLQTEDEHRLFSSNLHESYSPSMIVEVRFTLHDGVLDVKDTFHRSDKSKANDMAAANNIIQSAIKPVDDSGNIIRTEIWRWSNLIRTAVYDLAQKRIPDGGIILDIGTGSGQSTDSLANLKQCSFVLVEPDESKCKKLIKRLGIRQYYKDPRSVIPAVVQLKRRTVRYHVLNCTLDQIVKDTPLIQQLAKVVDYAVACFSAHFVTESLEILHQLKIKVTGCCYLYDGIEVNSSIIDVYGLTMKRVSVSTSEVTWGTDSTYSEPCLTRQDIPRSFVCIPASDLVQPHSMYMDIMTMISSHVWILRSR